MNTRPDLTLVLNFLEMPNSHCWIKWCHINNILHSMNAKSICYCMKTNKICQLVECWHWLILNRIFKKWTIKFEMNNNIFYFTNRGALYAFILFSAAKSFVYLFEYFRIEDANKTKEFSKYWQRLDIVDKIQSNDRQLLETNTDFKFGCLWNKIIINCVFDYFWIYIDDRRESTCFWVIFHWIYRQNNR